MCVALVVVGVTDTWVHMAAPWFAVTLAIPRLVPAVPGVRFTKDV